MTAPDQPGLSTTSDADAAGQDSAPTSRPTPKTPHNRSSCVSGGERSAPIWDERRADSTIEQCRDDLARFAEVVIGVELSQAQRDLLRTFEAGS